MKFVDDSQNLRIRLRIVQALVLLLLAVLGVRLYFLQVVKGAKYAEVAVNQRLRRLPILARRGAIIDRHGLLLVDSRPIYNILLSREDTKNIDRNSLIQPLAEGRSEEHTSELQSQSNLVCRLLLEKKKKKNK